MSPVAELFGRTFQTFRVRWRTLLGIMVLEAAGRTLLFAAAAVAVMVVLLGGLDSSALGTLKDRLQDVDFLAQHLLQLMGALTVFLIALAVFETWILTSLYFAAETPSAPMREALRRGAEHFGPFGWVLSLASLLPLAGAFFLVLPGLFLAVLFSLAPNAYFAEGKTGWSALARARDCVWPRLGAAAARLGLGWAAFAGAAVLASGVAVPLAADAVMGLALPLLVVYHSAVFRELAAAAGAA